MKFKHPVIIKGDIFSDERGELLYNNDFDLSSVKRFYVIRHPNKNIIRAWQGHQKEHKYFKCIKGSFVVAWKKIDDFSNPTDNNLPEYNILHKDENNILSIPPCYVNGLKALEDNSEIMVFSDHYHNEALDDNFRFDKNLWFDWEQF